MNAIQKTSSASTKKLFLGALFLFFTFSLLLSCDDVSDDDSKPKFSVKIFAGSGLRAHIDGKGTVAAFDYPSGLAVTSDGTIYVTELFNPRLRKITPDGLVSTSSTNYKSTATPNISCPGIAITANGTIYVTDARNHFIRKIPAVGEVSTFAGSGTAGDTNGQGTAAQFSSPNGIAVAADGTVYVVDTDKHRIRKITPGGLVSTFAGSGDRGSDDGQGAAAKFIDPTGIAVAADGMVYVADTGNNLIRKITPAGLVSTFAGSGSGNARIDGQGRMAQFSAPVGIALAADGTIYVTDSQNNSIRKITPAGKVSTIAKDIEDPRGIALSPNGSSAYVVSNYSIAYPVSNNPTNRIYKLSNLALAKNLP